MAINFHILPMVASVTLVNFYQFPIPRMNQIWNIYFGDIFSGLFFFFFFPTEVKITQLWK